MATRIYTPPPGFQERLIREGDPWTQNHFLGPTTVATGAVNVSAATAPGTNLVGKATWVEAITVSMSAPAIAQVQIPASADGRFPGFLHQFVVGTTPISVPVRQLIRNITHSNNGNVAVSIRNNLTAGSVDYYVGVSLNGYRITDDFDYDAEKPILYVGDSILNGTGPTKTANMWPFLVKDYLRGLGYDTRVILKSVSSSTTTEWENWRSAGYIDITDPALVVYAVSVNDAGAAVSDATYLANITAFWNWAKWNFPLAKCIICGTTPLENNTSETRAVGLRATASAYVTSVADARLKYIDLGTAFDRLVSGNYAATDTPGSRVHPNDTGHAAVATTFETAWASQGITI